VTDRDGATVLIHSGIIVGHAEVIEESQDLDRERLVQLEQSDVVNRQPGCPQGPLRGWNRADPITSGSTPAKP
jgi:hypothetical protein